MAANKSSYQLHSKTIQARYVFSKNNQVFLKHTFPKEVRQDKWAPIIFQWVPVPTS